MVTNVALFLVNQIRLKAFILEGNHTCNVVLVFLDILVPVFGRFYNGENFPFDSHNAVAGHKNTWQ